MKVYELSKDMGVDNSTILRAAKRAGFSDVIHHTNLIPDEILDMLKETVTAMPPEDEPTKPWNADNNPWALDMLATKRKRKGFKCRWVPRDGIQKKIDQGWKIAERRYYGGASAAMPGEESGEETLVRRRELILMELPNDLWEKRAEWLRHKTDLRTRSAVAIAKDQAKRAESESDGGVSLTESKFTSRQGY